MAKLNKHILVVGAGFSGAVIARELAEAGYTIDIIDKRPHVAGNAYDYCYGAGYPRVHKYGPHLFHTNNEKVWNYLQKYSEWVPYKHKVKALLRDGQFVTLPVNKETKEIVGEENVVDIFYRPYTRKMWGMEIEELNPDILKRVPIRDDMNEYYFPDDTFQALPKDGYTSLVKNILSHENICVYLSKEYDKHCEYAYDHIFNSMPIDEYYNYVHGELAYRSIKFTLRGRAWSETHGAATVNYTDDGKFTRYTCWNMLPNSPQYEFNLITYEEPCDYKENNMERYYPIKDIHGVNRAIYEKYKAIKNDKVTFIGRTGLYTYLDMHQAINIALQTAKKYIIENSSTIHNTSI